jgi:hypothetical protein
MGYQRARATTDHIRLDGKLRLAALSHDQEVIVVLTRQVENAEEQREWGREAIRKHESTAHPTANVAMPDNRPDGAMDTN